MSKLCVTGSEGAIGRPLVAELEAAGFTVRRLDAVLPAAHPGHGDVRNAADVREHIEGCRGIVHLAAVSRVVWGERDPDTCWAVNVAGTERIMEAAQRAPLRPWVILASSREVYGRQERLPVVEEAPKRPANVYGRSKLAAEQVALEARSAGLRVAVLRLSNVYGSLHDHSDRVAPAFCRAAAQGGTMTIHGPESTCDFTHVDDTVGGIAAAVMRLEAGGDLPDPINLATGVGTTLLQLALLAREAGGGLARIDARAPIRFAVDHFAGDPARANATLDWTARVGVEEGVRRLVAAWRGRMDPS